MNLSCLCNKSLNGYRGRDRSATGLNAAERHGVGMGNASHSGNGASSKKDDSRNYGIHPLDLKALLKQFAQSKVFPNPYSRGAYFYFVEALKVLGANKVHKFAAVQDQMRKLMSAPETKRADRKTDWERFSNKREVETDYNGRIMRNAEVLQRVNDYGLKLLQVGQKVLKTKGMVVDIMKGENRSPLYRLNTDSAEPLNEFRRRRS
jgi:hypothetical protein